MFCERPIREYLSLDDQDLGRGVLVSSTFGYNRVIRSTCWFVSEFEDEVQLPAAILQSYLPSPLRHRGVQVSMGFYCAVSFCPAKNLHFGAFLRYFIITPFILQDNHFVPIPEKKAMKKGKIWSIILLGRGSKRKKEEETDKKGKKLKKMYNYPVDRNENWKDRF